MKSKRSRRKKFDRNHLVYAFGLILISLIVIYVVAEYRNPPSSAENTTKKNAADYFGFSDISGEGTNVTGADAIRISTLYVAITAKGGNVSELSILASGMTDPQDYSNYNIPMNETLNLTLKFKSPVQVKKEGSAYPVSIRLDSKEAAGTVTLYMPESSFFAE